MSNELKNAIELACQAGRATPAQRQQLLATLNEGETRPKEKLIQTKEAAAILEACGKTVFRYEQRGLLHAIRRSKRCIRWRKSEVERLALTGVGVAQ